MRKYAQQPELRELHLYLVTSRSFHHPIALLLIILSAHVHSFNNQHFQSHTYHHQLFRLKGVRLVDQAIFCSPQLPSLTLVHHVVSQSNSLSLNSEHRASESAARRHPIAAQHSRRMIRFSFFKNLSKTVCKRRRGICEERPK